MTAEAYCLREAATPSVAAVNGPAVGAGCDFALACDVRIVGPEASLREGFVNVGLVPGDGGAWLLPRLVGEAKAKEYLLTGREITPEAAVDMGLAVEEVDDAIRRSGRFDERIEVPPPDRTARKAILRIHLRDKPVVTEDIDWEAVADMTEGFVASDMELVATEAAFEAISEVDEDDTIEPIRQSHIERAIEGMEPTGA